MADYVLKTTFAALAKNLGIGDVIYGLGCHAGFGAAQDHGGLGDVTYMQCHITTANDHMRIADAEEPMLSVSFLPGQNMKVGPHLYSRYRPQIEFGLVAYPALGSLVVPGMNPEDLLLELEGLEMQTGEFAPFADHSAAITFIRDTRITIAKLRDYKLPRLTHRFAVGQPS